MTTRLSFSLSQGATPPNRSESRWFSGAPGARARWVLAAVVGLAVLGCAASGDARVEGAAPAPPPNIGPGWQEEVDVLVRGGKLQEALEKARAERQRQERLAPPEPWAWTRALVNETQLEVALRGFETAAETLREAEWPQDPQARAVLSLYQGEAIAGYLRAYDWEIDQRERVAVADGSDPLDRPLAELDHGELRALALRHLLVAWEVRAELAAFAAREWKGLIEPGSYPDEIRGSLRDVVSYLLATFLADSGLWTAEEANGLHRLDVGGLAHGRVLPAGGDAAAPALAADDLLRDPATHPLVQLAAVLADLEAWHRAAGRQEASLEAARVRVMSLADHLHRDRTTLREVLAERLAAVADLPWSAVAMASVVELRGAEPDPAALAAAERLAAGCAERWAATLGGKLCAAQRARLLEPAIEVAGMAADGPGRRSVEVRHKLLSGVEVSLHRHEVDPLGRMDLRPAELERLVTELPVVARWFEPLPDTPDLRSHRSYLTLPADLAAGGYLVVVRARPAARSLAAGVAVEPGEAALLLTVGDLVLTAQPAPLSAKEAAGGTPGTGGAGARRAQPGRPPGMGAAGLGVEPLVVEARALAGATGVPRAGVEVILLHWVNREGWSPVASGKTASDGTVRLLLPGSREPWRGYRLVARAGAEQALIEHLSVGPGVEEAMRGAVVFTDRSLYRPGQTVLWKVLLYEHGGEGPPRPAADTATTVRLRDPNWEEVATATVASNRYGTASGSFVLPAGRPLGRWQLEVEAGTSQPIAVEEYVRPTFEVAVEPPAAGLRVGVAAEVAGEARYFFGLPVSVGAVRYRVERIPLRPWWCAPWRISSWWGEQSAELVANGETALAADGRFRFSFVPEVDARALAEGMAYRFRVTAEVTDEAGETRTGDRSVTLGATDVVAAIELPGPFVVQEPGASAAVVVRRSDLDGAPRAGTGQWQLVALVPPDAPVLPADLPEAGGGRPVVPMPRARGPAGQEPGEAPGEEPFQTPGDRLRPRWQTAYDWREVVAQWPAGEVVARGELAHDAQGRARLQLPAGLAAGAYQLRYETVDGAGAPFATSAELLVGAGRRGRLVAGTDQRAGRGSSGAGAPSGQPVAGLALALATDRPAARVGEVVSVLAGSGIPGQPLWLEKHRSGRRVAAWALEAGQAEAVWSLPIDAEDRGGFALRLWTVRDHQRIELASEVAVPWEQHALAVETVRFRDVLRPGTRERWQVRVRRAEQQPSSDAPVAAVPGDGARPAADGAAAPTAGTPIAGAELLALMSDRSLDMFAPHALPPLDGLFPRRAYAALAAASSGRLAALRWLHYQRSSPPEVPTPTPAALVWLDDWGVGGPGRRHLAMSKAMPQAAMAEEGGPEVLSAPAPAAAPPPPGASREAADAASGGAPSEPEPAKTLRSNFAETALWEPHLITAADGTATIEFTVPDAVTAWNVWVQALGPRLEHGVLALQARTVKDLLARPYLPRFLRAGDRAELAVAVANSGAEALAGDVELVLRGADGEDLAAAFGVDPAAVRQPFRVGPGETATVVYALEAPREVQDVEVQVMARAGDLADGELRPLPILPSRFALVESRTAALRGDRRELVFPSLLADDDPTRQSEQLVVTVDAQLFQSVLAALPYLASYPYECAEQTANRFVSAAMVDALFRRHPELAPLAADLARRRGDRTLEPWRANDPNRRLALEETPWLAVARGGASSADLGPGGELAQLLDPAVARATRSDALARLERMQLGSGAWPWFADGPPSPWVTIYVLSSLARAIEAEVEVPQEMVESAWQYLASELGAEWREPRTQRCCRELLVFLNYVASAYPDPSWTGEALSPEDRLRILELSLERWQDFSPYVRGMLALTAHRMDRRQEAKAVWDAVMDSARTTPDEGTTWVREARSWLWYEDTVETHAFALRVLTELAPEDPRAAGLVQWLLLNKTLNHWGSTRATAEVLDALTRYLDRQGLLGGREEVAVALGGERHEVVFEPDRYVGRVQVVVPGERVTPAHGRVEVAAASPAPAFATATWHYTSDRPPAAGAGDLFGVERRYYRRVRQAGEVVRQPLDQGAVLTVGDEVEVELRLTSRHPAEYVHLRDPRPAGLEPDRPDSGWRWDLATPYYLESRDSATNLFLEQLPQGEVVFRYRLRAATGGSFRAAPAVVQSMYAPQHGAHSAGGELVIRRPER
jgi:hypothetical protein